MEEHNAGLVQSFFPEQSAGIVASGSGEYRQEKRGATKPSSRIFSSIQPKENKDFYGVASPVITVMAAVPGNFDGEGCQKRLGRDISLERTRRRSRIHRPHKCSFTRGYVYCNTHMRYTFRDKILEVVIGYDI